MIPLFRKLFPSHKADLTEALDEAMHRFVEKPGTIVDLRSRVFPYVDLIAINLDGGIVDLRPPPTAQSEGETGRAFECANIEVSGKKLSIGGVPLDLRMEMRDAIFDWGYDANAEAVLILGSAREGQLVVSAAQLLLERAFIQIVGAKARLYGIALEQVRLFMRARGRRSIAADIQIVAKKFSRAPRSTFTRSWTSATTSSSKFHSSNAKATANSGRLFAKRCNPCSSASSKNLSRSDRFRFSARSNSATSTSRSPTPLI
jgi:hypothetical protein